MPRWVRRDLLARTVHDAKERIKYLKEQKSTSAFLGTIVHRLLGV